MYRKSTSKWLYRLSVLLLMGMLWVGVMASSTQAAPLTNIPIGPTGMDKIVNTNGWTWSGGVIP